MAGGCSLDSCGEAAPAHRWPQARAWPHPDVASQWLSSGWAGHGGLVQSTAILAASRRWRKQEEPDQGPKSQAGAGEPTPGQPEGQCWTRRPAVLDDSWVTSTPLAAHSLMPLTALLCASVSPSVAESGWQSLSAAERITGAIPSRSLLSEPSHKPEPRPAPACPPAPLGLPALPELPSSASWAQAAPLPAPARDPPHPTSSGAGQPPRP